jgi:hypothetical protein
LAICISISFTELSYQLQDFSGMAAGIHAMERMAHDTFPIKNKSRALDRQSPNRFPFPVFFLKHTEKPAYLSFRIRQELERQAMLDVHVGIGQDKSRRSVPFFQHAPPTGFSAILTVTALEVTPEHESHDGFPHPPPLSPKGRGERRESLPRLSQ